MWRVERVPCGIVDGDIQQRQQRRQERLQRAVQHQELARHAFADLRGSSRSWIRQYAFSKLDDGQVRRGLPIGDRAALEHQPAVRTVRPRELPDEPRFPHAGLAHDGDDLPVPGGCTLERLSQLLQLTVAADKAGQAAGGAGLQAGTVPGRSRSARRPESGSRAPSR